MTRNLDPNSPVPEQGVVTNRFRGWPAVTLQGGDLRATFIPQLGMLGASLRWRGRELLSLHGGLDGWLAGHTTGMPLLAPWANRLGSLGYRAGRTRVDLRGAPHLHLDPNGLPIHGTLLGRHDWSVARVAHDSDRGVLGATFAFAEHPDLMRSFPFAHELEVEVIVDDRSLSVSTIVRPTGRVSVPISFGWHPYFRLPGARRSDLSVHLPARSRIEVDECQLPTGRLSRKPAAIIPLASRTFDDGYRLGRSRRFRISARPGVGAVQALAIEFDRGYAFLQVYAPVGKPFVAIEPMTAPTNALVTGEHPWVRPGEQFAASFRVSVEPA